jgi:hypothetical protein
VCGVVQKVAFSRSLDCNGGAVDWIAVFEALGRVGTLLMGVAAILMHTKRMASKFVANFSFAAFSSR